MVNTPDISLEIFLWWKCNPYNLLDSKILYFKLSELIVPTQQDSVVQHLIQFVISLRYYAHCDWLM